MPQKPAGPLGIASWCLYDWANSAYNTVIGTFIFSVYFAGGVDSSGERWGIVGDATAGSSMWSYAIGLSAVGMALLSPVLGAIADQSGPRKPWIALLVALTVIPTALLWFAAPSPDYIVYALALVVISNIAFELSVVFYNAMLPSIAPAGKTGRVSGWAWGVGYLGGLACLAVALLGFVGLGDTAPWFDLPRENSEHVRATSLLVAAWFVLFSLPLFLLTPDVPSRRRPIRQAVRDGVGTLLQTLREVRRYREVVRFLIASALYRDGIITITAIGGLYASGTFDMGFDQIILFAIGLNVTAGLGAIGFAWVDDWIGSKKTVLLSIVGLLAFGAPLVFITEADTFIILGLGLGIFFGPVQAASRTMMAKLSPVGKEGEFFGLYGFTGKSIAFAGPALFGLATDLFDSQRAGVSTILLFFIAGGLLLLTIREPGPVRSGRPAPA